MTKKLSIGGQAVIEGVMIRSLKHYVVSVRKKNKIITKKGKIRERKSKFYRLPVVRGFFNLVDMLVIGIKTLIWSAEQQTGEKEKISRAEFAFTIAFSLGFAALLFIALPYFLTLIVGFKEESEPFLFNLIDGIIRIGVFLLYILAISFMKDVKTLFRYHGAEHMSIHCYEHGKRLNVENIKRFSTLHPRCGTAFIMIVLIVSILVFSLLPTIIIYLFPNFVYLNVFLRKIILFLLRISLIPVVAGISYELLKLSAKYEKNRMISLFIQPGLLLQKITTNKPSKKQIEVAMEAVKKILQLEKSKNI
jgi:uncharacterized protein YqhQ